MADVANGYEAMAELLNLILALAEKVTVAGGGGGGGSGGESGGETVAPASGVIGAKVARLADKDRVAAARKHAQEVRMSETMVDVGSDWMAAGRTPMVTYSGYNATPRLAAIAASHPELARYARARLDGDGISPEKFRTFVRMAASVLRDINDYVHSRWADTYVAGCNTLFGSELSLEMRPAAMEVPTDAAAAATAAAAAAAAAAEDAEATVAPAAGSAPAMGLTVAEAFDMDEPPPPLMGRSRACE
jgi:hypothetical protein